MKKSCKITVILLCSVLLLGACSKKEKSSQVSTSHSKVTQVSKSSTKKKKVTKNSSSTELSSSISAPNSQDSSNDSSVAESGEVGTQENSQSTTPTTASSISVENIANGDFSTIAGTWSNDLGESVTVDSNGQTSISSHSESYLITSNTLEGNVSFGTIYNSDSEYGSAAFIIIPAGTANPYSGEVVAVDTIVIGQGGDANQHPYYRN
ncbi:DUF6287 domain-containing protein [Streptococcus gallolyticus]|uniref:DUF6287 domain-containing protein n=1 Tax=Streptococcus gallolyticus TaxID=315405 RepID=UPI0022834BF9|nr:DUF6287 domain-containing protein [Streptococcus gallolyticus]MCY7186232.1 DUF6287 domain-containing protein [Streptococcus gallolyticus subsp. gallolyticus]MCY7189241.1 DUF6287 domain-containing protein [Streptococcus gallolyticus subsp. gallolyticus]